MIVMKFGGSSLATGDALTRAAGLIAARVRQAPVVVVSAPGKTTDGLAAAVDLAARGALAEARRRVATVRRDLAAAAGPVLADAAALEALLDAHGDELDGTLSDLASGDERARPRLTDAALSHGERISSVVMARLLRQRGVDAVHVDARDVLVTDDRFTEAAPRFGPTDERLRRVVRPLAASARVAVLGGFIARTADGRPSTLGRGGSDFSAAIAGAGIGADEIQIWTDVDGVMTADPALVPDARPLPRLSFAEASELAYFGGRVLHPRTVLPAMEANIPVRVLNSRKPEARGTLIVAACPPSDMTVKSIASKRGITVIDIRSTRMLMAHGFLAAIFEVFDRMRTAVDIVSTSEVAVSLTIDRTDRLADVVNELRRIADVRHTGGQAIVCLVGEAIRRTPGVAAAVFTALRAIDVRLVSQSSARTNLSLVVDERDVPAAVRKLHAAFFAGGAE